MIGWPYDGVNPNPPPAPVDFFTEPESLVAGATLLFYRALDFAPANLWTLAYVAVGEANRFTFAGAPDQRSGDLNFVINVPAAITALWKPDRYKLQGLAVNVSDNSNIDMPVGTVRTVFDGWLEVKPGLETVQGNQDARSKWMKIRDAVLDVILRRASQEILISGIEGETFNYMTHDQLLALYNRAEQNVKIELAQARAKQGLPDGSTIYARFTAPF